MAAEPLKEKGDFSYPQPVYGGSPVRAAGPHPGHPWKARRPESRGGCRLPPWGVLGARRCFAAFAAAAKGPTAGILGAGVAHDGIPVLVGAA